MLSVMRSLVPGMRSVVMIVIALLATGFYIWYTLDSARVARAAVVCNEKKEDAPRIDCWMEIIRVELKKGGVARAMHAFSSIYETYPMFANTGCHRHAHRVGDIAYYEYYLQFENLEKIEFPVETTSCGYGFFHGFLEHLIQDNSTRAFVTETCEYLAARLTSEMGDIRRVCYHGAGHGLMLAHAETVTKGNWGKVSVFVDAPLLICESLPTASEDEIEECREGVFNVLVDWMETKEYGFSYNRENPFVICNTQPQGRQYACYYEMSMKLDSVAHQDPQNLADFVESIKNESYKNLAFRIGVTGMVQHIVSSDEYVLLFNSCAKLSDAFAVLCTESIVAGLFEHGRPREEYVMAGVFCSTPGVADRGLESHCWKAFIHKLPRFYDDALVESLCAQIPASFNLKCRIPRQLGFGDECAPDRGSGKQGVSPCRR